MKVLYLSAWYPTEKDQMAGLFVKKHAEAVRAQGVDARVYHYEQIPHGWRPDLIQLNVLSLKNALRTYWLHLWYRVPYIIVEHWSRYLPQNNTFPHGIEGAILRFVARHASMILPVSQVLMQAMKDNGIENDHWQLIHNVVDDFFYEKPTSNPTQLADVTRMLHVSCFDEKSKNIKGLLRAMEQLSKQRQDWHLTIVGTGQDFDEVRAYAHTLDIPKSQMTWTGELTPQEVKEQMDKADVFVLFSNYETYGIVLAEAAAVGLPIISTPVGIAPQLIKKQNGVLVATGDENALTQAIVQLMDQPVLNDRDATQQMASDCRFDVVGNNLWHIYEKIAHL